MHTTDPAISVFEPRIKAYFDREDIAGPLNYLQHCLPAGARLFAAGGALRNLLIQAVHGAAPATRDIDLFIGDLGPEVSLACALDGQQKDLTDLCGIRWQPESSDLAFDICRLCDFVIIKAYRLAPSLENLLHTLDFTLNAVVFDVGDRQLYENGCLAAIQDRCLDFNTTYRMSKLLLAYRVLLIRFKTGFVLAERVFAFLKYRLDIDTIRPLRGLLAGKQGREAAAVIMADYNRICRYTDYREYLRQAPEAA
jgi:hypothetical protein